MLLPVTRSSTLSRPGFKFFIVISSKKPCWLGSPRGFHHQGGLTFILSSLFYFRSTGLEALEQEDQGRRDLPPSVRGRMATCQSWPTRYFSRLRSRSPVFSCLFVHDSPSRALIGLWRRTESYMVAGKRASEHTTTMVASSHCELLTPPASYISSQIKII